MFKPKQNGEGVIQKETSFILCYIILFQFWSHTQLGSGHTRGSWVTYGGAWET